VIDSTPVAFSVRYRRPARWITARGLLRTTGDAVVLEWHEHVLNTATAKRSRGPLQSAEIPLHALDTLQVQRGLLGARRLVIRARSLEALDGIPFAAADRCVLRLDRGDAFRARELSASVQEQIAEAGLRRLRDAGDGGFDALTG
jgi:hypothetical protein